MNTSSHLSAVPDDGGDTAVMDAETDEAVDEVDEFDEASEPIDVDAYERRAPEAIGSHPLLERATETGITFTSKTGRTEFAEFLPVLVKLENFGPWGLGDSLNFAEDRWGEAASAFLDIDGISPSTASNAQSLCRAYPEPTRFPELRPTHHRDALKLTEPHRTHALKFAAVHRLSTTEFRDYVEQVVADIPDAQSDGSAARERPRTHVTYTLSFTLPIGDEEDGSKVHDALHEALKRRLKKDNLQATKISPNISYPKNIQA